MGCQNQVRPQEETNYTYSNASRDGIGKKFYMGREISQIMGFHGMAWFGATGQV